MIKKDWSKNKILEISNKEYVNQRESVALALIKGYSKNEKRR